MDRIKKKMNRKGVLATPVIIFGIIMFVIIFTTVIVSIGEVTDNYDMNLNQSEYQDVFQDINITQADLDALQNRYTDEAQKARGEGTEVDQGFTAVFRGIKVTGDALDLTQDAVPGFQRLFGWIPTYIWGLLLFVVAMLIAFAIYSDLRGKWQR